MPARSLSGLQRCLIRLQRERGLRVTPGCTPPDGNTTATNRCHIPKPSPPKPSSCGMMMMSGTSVYRAMFQPLDLRSST